MSYHLVRCVYCNRLIWRRQFDWTWRYPGPGPIHFACKCERDSGARPAPRWLHRIRVWRIRMREAAR